LHRKEEAPHSVSLSELWKFCIESEGRTTHEKWLANLPGSLDFVLRFHSQNPGFFTVKYEDMVDNKLGALEEYLGAELKGEARVSSHYGRVERTKAYGNWRDWFTASDVPLFQAACRAYMAAFGYEDEWTLNPAARIPVEHASGYVRRLINQQRAE